MPDPGVEGYPLAGLLPRGAVRAAGDGNARRARGLCAVNEGYDPPMIPSLTTETTPQRLPGYGRRCGLWVAADCRAITLVDTAAIDVTDPAQTWFLHGHELPEDCLLVIVSPALERTLRAQAAERVDLVSGPMIAAEMIDGLLRDPARRRQLRW